MSENTDRSEPMTVTPSKDRAEAYMVPYLAAAMRALLVPESAYVGSVADALAAAHADGFAEGMKRAAEIARRQAKFRLDASAMSLPVEPSPIIAKDRAKIATIIAEAILSETGEA